MRRWVETIGLVAVAVTMTAGSAFGWAWATHAHVAVRTGLERCPAELNEIYGGVAADVFNFYFDDPALMELLATATHADAEQVWDAWRNQPEREMAFGFVSHNEVWGADMTAHQFGLTFGGPQSGKGYIIAKADLLLDAGLGDAFAAMGLPPEAAVLMAHILVENAIDLMLAEQSPELGAQLSRAGLYRHPLLPKLLVRAYGDLAPEALIVGIEEGFRSNLIAYGQMLQQPPEIALQMMAYLLVQQAKAYLAMFPGVPVPDDATLAALALAGLNAGKALCAGDYQAELDATVLYLADELTTRGVNYR